MFKSAHAKNSNWETAVQSCVKQISGGIPGNLGFMYITEPLSSHLEQVLDAFRQLTGIEQWVGSVAVTKKLIDKYEPQVFRAYKDRISRFKDSGWSFSSFGGISRIKVKFEAFAHQEYNKNEYINEEHLKKSAELGTDI